LATLLALTGLLGGGAAPPTVTVTVTKGTSVVTTLNTITVSPAVYNEPVLTPPKISGLFLVPRGRGIHTVTVNYVANLLGFPLANTASATLRVR
jgi:hypothetical protein